MESESLSSEIAQRKELLEKIEAEDRVVTKVREENKYYALWTITGLSSLGEEQGRADQQRGKEKAGGLQSTWCEY